jgi:hypothetical protein
MRFYDRLEKMVFFLRKFIHFIYRKNKSPVQKLTTPLGNIPIIKFWLGLWTSLCANKTLQTCTNTNLLRNQTNGVLTIGSRKWSFYEGLCTLNTEGTNRRSKMALWRGHLPNILLALGLWLKALSP